MNRSELIVKIQKEGSLSQGVAEKVLDLVLDNVAPVFDSPRPTKPDITATERLVAVRQILDKSAIIFEQIARKAQGGMRFFNEIPYFTAVHNCDLKVVAASHVYREYFGNQIGAYSWEAYCGKLATPEQCPVGRTVATGNAQSVSAVVRYKSGAKIPSLVYTSPIFNNDGRMEFVLEVIAGTHEIDHLADRITTTQQNFETLFDAVPSNIVVLDRRCHVASHNRTFENNFGPCIGQPFFEVLNPASFPTHRDPITKSLRSGTSCKDEMVLTDPQGQAYNFLAWTTPIFSPTGKFIQLLVILLDITDLRRAQDNLSSLGLMLSTVSHDIKGALTGLEAGLYLIDTGFYRDQSGRIEEGLDTLKLIVERLRSLVLDVLTHAKEREVQLQEVRIKDFLFEITAQLNVKMKAAGIEFLTDFDGVRGKARIDPNLLRSALINLLENAVESCIEDRRPSIRHCIRFDAKASSGRIRIRVSDNGPGMDEGQKRNLFKKFSSSKGYKGTGLGLFMSRSAIQKHEGTIEVQTAPEQGCIFTIQIPR